MDSLSESQASLPGQRFGEATIAIADDFASTDPVDGAVNTGPGVRIQFPDGSRIGLRLSSTGTEGATLRVSLARFELDASVQRAEAQIALSTLALFSA